MSICREPPVGESKVAENTGQNIGRKHSMLQVISTFLLHFGILYAPLTQS